jgi:hypothetical protein
MLLLFWKRPRSNFQPKYFALRHAGDAVESGEMEALKYNDESGDDSRKDSGDEDHADEEDKEAALATGSGTTEGNFPPRLARLRARGPLRALEGDEGPGCGVP